MDAVVIGAWLLVFASLLLLQGLALIHGAPWPTMSSMLRASMRPLIGRVALFGLWLWIGWHLFIRGWTFFMKA
jgi:Family of unknown function (DUF6186)